MKKEKGFAAFGEVMLRLGAPDRLRLVQTLPGELVATYGGGEANVCVALAALGVYCRFLSVLPDNPMTQALVAELRRYNVDTTHLELGAPGRLGLYFLEQGANQRGSGVWYDRENSAIALKPAKEYNFDSMLEGVEHLHLTGITPALSRNAFDATLALARRAAEMGCTVSCDLNFRKKLWNWEPGTPKTELAKRCMTQIVSYADWIIGNEADAADVFGIRPATGDCETGKLDISGYQEVAASLVSMFPKASKIAFTLRGSVSADYNEWGGMLYDCRTGQCRFAPCDANGNYVPYAIRDIVDRFGGGDSFSAGLVYALHDPELAALDTAVGFAAAASCLKHSIFGDFNLISKSDVLTLMKGNGSGRVVR